MSNNSKMVLMADYITLFKCELYNFIGLCLNGHSKDEQSLCGWCLS